MKKIVAMAAVPIVALTASCTQSIKGEAHHWPTNQGGADTSAEWPSSESSPSTASPSTVSPPPEPDEPPTNARGNYETQVGEQQDVVVVATGAPVLSFTVTAITPGFQCTGSYADPPENGQFVGITMTFTTTDLSELGGNLHLSGYDFQVIGTDGSLENESNTLATYGCLSSSEQFPSGGIGQGVSATTTFVLDTKHAAGFIVFRPSFLDGGGWEYTF